VQLVLSARHACCKLALAKRSSTSWGADKRALHWYFCLEVKEKVVILWIESDPV